MKRRPRRPETNAYERSLRKPQPKQYVLRLYVAGASPRSLRAIQNIRRFCEEQLKGQYTLEIVDVYQQPALARVDQVVAAPTLIKLEPRPARRLIGDMSNLNRILAGMGLPARP